MNPHDAETIADQVESVARDISREADAAKEVPRDWHENLDLMECRQALEQLQALVLFLERAKGCR